ncbi:MULTISPECIES: hypothetical protein [Chryseobacterium]|uniref:Uncharacterized protein n=1 Tax=Chryseobacterium geocarposphaerae TaxID=1416776 RepID=A0ABU1LGL9_9FLAO|nr:MULTISPECIES: hypothetical protein [Chryseobacterium]MDR6405871.1 hypothetical protein [Chryseobacterium geocarposphaerae]MDR6698965.1 hypothetical protein [Chryseobacterium ginsenosidimutans]
MIDFFGKIFGNKDAQRNIDIKNIKESNINIVQIEKFDISNFINSPYQNVIIGSSLRKSSSSILINNISNRKNTIKNIMSDWGDKTWLNLYGGFDTGKTQLSLLIEKHLAFENVLNYNFKELSKAEFQNIISLLFAQFLSGNINDSSQNINLKLIILDDLPEFGLDENVNTLFTQFITFCKENNIKVLSTSNYKIHSKITKTIISNFYELQIPLLTKEEIEEVIFTYKTEERLRSFSTIILAISTGYPIYVQIICRYLDSKEWSLTDENLAEFISGKSFDELDDETYQKLFSSTQDENSRELLYRLNIVLGAINNEIVELVSKINPIVEKPFEKIKNLNGTWLQKNNDDTYFISPLIKRLGSNNVLFETRKEINNSLAKSILAKNTISQYEGQRAMTYFLAGESFDDAGIIMTMGLQTYFTNPKLFLDSVFKSLWVNSELPNKMSLILKSSIRSLQLHIYIDSQIKNNNIYNEDDKDFIKDDLELILQGDLELIPKEILNISYLMLFRCYLQGDNVEKALFYICKLYTTSLRSLDGFDESVKANFWTVLDKISELKEIRIWFEAFDLIGKTEDYYDKALIHLFSRRLIDNIVEKYEGDWNTIIKLLEYIIQESNLRKLELLNAYSCKTMFFIFAEKYKDINRATSFYNNIKKDFSNPEAVFVIQDEFGRQQFYSGDKENALTTLLEIENTNIISQTKVDTYITIAKIFGEKDKNLAHVYTKKAYDYAENKLQVTKLTLSKLRAEYAISFWFLGDYKASLYNLSDAYELLISGYEEIDRFDNINDFNITTLRIGAVINYIWQTVHFERMPQNYDGSPLPKPQRGVLSNSYDPANLKEWYNDEKKYLNMYILVEMFEYYEDKSMAIKWSNYAFELNKKIIFYTQKHTLRTMLGYKIIQDLYQEAIELDGEIKLFENSLNEGMVHEIESNLLKEAFLEKIKKGKRLDINDDYYYISNIIPIIIKELTELLNCKISILDCTSRIKEHLLRNNNLFRNKESLEHINYILDNFPNNQTECKNLLNWFSDLENVESKESIQVILYLCCSINAPTKQALNLHLASMPYLEVLIRGLSSSIHLFILYPFILKFWTSRALEKPQDFYFLELWRKNLEKSTAVKNEFKVIAIIALICMHLRYLPSEAEESWMAKYISHVRENN